VLQAWAGLKAELRRHFAILWSYPGDTFSWLLYTCLMFIAMVVILNGITGGAYNTEKQLLMLVGWLTWQMAAGCMSSLTTAISEDAEAGTLEQVCLSPVPLSVVFAARSTASLLVTAARGVIAAIVLLLVVRFPGGFGAGAYSDEIVHLFRSCRPPIGAKRR